ncbi:MAG: Ig-like domain-containing protein, partial [Gaiellaceae bacterium]
MSTSFRLALVSVLLLVWAPSALAGVTPTQPFPTNLQTVADATQATGLRVSLPLPNCAARPSDCADIAVLNTLDGFSLQPRISVPFSGAIDLNTVSSDTVFLADPAGKRIGINQVVWEPLSSTLHVEPDSLLEQATPYLIVVTDDLRSADGSQLDASQFRRFLNFGQTGDPAEKAYRKALLGALHWSGVAPGHIVDAALFTTQSITAISEKIRRRLDASLPAPVSFTIGTLGERAALSFSSVLGLVVKRQVGTAPTFSTSTIPAAIPVVPSAIGTVAFGRFSSPDYETAAKVIPAYGTATGTPLPLGTNDLYVNVYLPSGPEPAGGWPVAIFGHGFGDSRNGAPWVVASSLAHAGIATVAINVVGHGFGPAGTYVVTTPAGTVTLNAGGRAIDQNSSGTFDSTEGVNATGSQTLIGNRDGLRQTVVDIMQLVGQLQAGVDV